MARKDNRRYKKKKDRNGAYDNKDGSGVQAPYREDFAQTTTLQGNFKMESYYALQGIYDHRYNDEGQLVACTTSEEKDAERLLWRKTIATILPASFRTAYDISEALKEKLESELEELITEQKKEAAATAALASATKEPATATGSEEPAAATATFTTLAAIDDDTTTANKEIVKKLPFLPHAYQLYTDRKFIRKDPSMKKLHLWLRKQTDAGFITRQETVSMVPPVVLAPQPDDIVLDMCAAPGSKTCQILEKLSTEGCMIANDSSAQRAYMLVSQLRRIMHNNPVVMITSCDGQFFPQTLSFDRILADVPCSGDGTSRKNIGIWKHWNQLGALALHNLQLDIAWKGVQLLKVGGYIVYSTCSHNPIENEAVVAELLRKSEGCLELVDAPLEGFKVRPGMHTWKVLAEEKSNRQMKNEKKKNNAKMRQKRAEIAEKEGTLANADGGEDATAEATGVDVAATADASEEVKAKEEDEIEETVDEVVNVRPRFVPPTTWDEESLLSLTKESGLKHYKTLDEVPDNLQKRIKASCFPPTAEEVEKLHLEKCIRCLSQDNDTGGFFVALLKKTAPISRREVNQIRRSTEGEDTENAAASDDGPASKKMKPNGDEEDKAETEVVMATDDAGNDEGPQSETAMAMDDAVNNDDSKSEKAPKGNQRQKDLGSDNFVTVDKKMFDPMIDFYGFTDSFPKHQFMARSAGLAKTVYYLAKSVKEHFIDTNLQERITIVGSGIKGFVRNTNSDATETPYRISQEGVHFILPHMTKRRVSITPEDFEKCMAGNGKVIPLTTFSEEFNAQATPLAPGPFVAILKGYETDYAAKLVLVMWRCRSDNVNCLVKKEEIEGMRVKVSSALA